MIQKRYNGNWYVDVLIDEIWTEVAEVNSEEEADNIIEILTNWLIFNLEIPID